MSEDLEQIRLRMAAFKAAGLPAEMKVHFRPSAVLIPIYVKDGEVRIILTKRSTQVRHHKGQISFPGGRRDAGESPMECALRESEEELGLRRDQIRVLGRLDETLVISNYRIRPFVGEIVEPPALRVSDVEIEQVFDVPLRTFIDPAIYSFSLNEYQGALVPMHFYRAAFEGAAPEDVVWGATGRILTQFLHVVFGYLGPAFREYLSQGDHDPFLTGIR